jgi:hypothetical protein
MAQAHGKPLRRHAEILRREKVRGPNLLHATNFLRNINAKPRQQAGFSIQNTLVRLL